MAIDPYRIGSLNATPAVAPAPTQQYTGLGLGAITAGNPNTATTKAYQTPIYSGGSFYYPTFGVDAQGNPITTAASAAQAAAGAAAAAPAPATPAPAPAAAAPSPTAGSPIAVNPRQDAVGGAEGAGGQEGAGGGGGTPGFGAAFDAANSGAANTPSGPSFTQADGSTETPLNGGGLTTNQQLADFMQSPDIAPQTTSFDPSLGTIGGGILGGIAGGLFGGPSGAVTGASLGAKAGNSLDPSSTDFTAGVSTVDPTMDAALQNAPATNNGFITGSGYTSAPAASDNSGGSGNADGPDFSGGPAAQGASGFGQGIDFGGSDLTGQGTGNNDGASSPEFESSASDGGDSGDDGGDNGGGGGGDEGGDSGGGGDDGGGDGGGNNENEGGGYSKGGFVTKNRLAPSVPSRNPTMLAGAPQSSKPWMQARPIGAPPPPQQPPGGPTRGLPQNPNQPHGFAQGGPVTPGALSGPNPPGPDQGYAALKPGEFVVRSGPAQQNASLLSSINAGGAPSAAPGGPPPMPPSAPPASGFPPPVSTTPSPALASDQGADDPADVGDGDDSMYGSEDVGDPSDVGSPLMPANSAMALTPQSAMQHINELPGDQRQVLAMSLADPTMAGAMLSILGPPFASVIQAMQTQGPMAGHGSVPPGGDPSLPDPQAGPAPPPNASPPGVPASALGQISAG